MEKKLDEEVTKRIREAKLAAREDVQWKELADELVRAQLGPDNDLETEAEMAMATMTNHSYG